MSMLLSAYEWFPVGVNPFTMVRDRNIRLRRFYETLVYSESAAEFAGNRYRVRSAVVQEELNGAPTANAVGIA